MRELSFLKASSVNSNVVPPLVKKIKKIGIICSPYSDIAIVVARTARETIPWKSEPYLFPTDLFI